MLSPKDLQAMLQKQRHAAEENDAKRRAERLRLPYMDLVSLHVPTELKAMALVPEESARAGLLVPLQLLRKKLVLAVFDPTLPETKKVADELKKKYEVSVVVASKSGLAFLWTFYKYVANEMDEISGRVEIDEANLSNILGNVKTLGNLKALIEGFKGQRTSELLEIILGGAMALRSSDIHLEPTKEWGVFRLRIDGLLHTATDQFPLGAYHSVITRIKLLSNLKLNITDQAQDGRFTIALKDRDIEIRTSIIPSEYGETIVMRLLDPNALKVNLEELGWRSDDLGIVTNVLKEPNGLILNTGPTGSGKTTTLYAFLKYILTPEIKIITVEDPIEYHIAGISQTQVDTDANYTFASGLRSILRQDPDVILVGEIRDEETADIAMNASLTGHMVFSTLHTNDAVGAIPRLLDLGAKPQVLAPALSLVIAQRLVRRLCPTCKTAKKTDQKTAKQFEVFLENLPKRVDRAVYTTITVFESKGCEKCGGLGYKGRTSLFELFEVGEKIETAIYENPNELRLKKLANEQGMSTMQADGILKVFQGITTFAEVEGVTGPIEWKT
ncbi:MAG: GspE/PulE family protein [Patescibacteria group bacterium]